MVTIDENGHNLYRDNKSNDVYFEINNGTCNLSNVIIDNSTILTTYDIDVFDGVLGYVALSIIFFIWFSRRWYIYEEKF